MTNIYESLWLFPIVLIFIYSIYTFIRKYKADISSETARPQQMQYANLKRTWYCLVTEQNQHFDVFFSEEKALNVCLQKTSSQFLASTDSTNAAVDFLVADDMFGCCSKLIGFSIFSFEMALHLDDRHEVAKTAKVLFNSYKNLKSRNLKDDRLTILIEKS